jgi:hypothetical protein
VPGAGPATTSGGASTNPSAPDKGN